MSCLGTRCAGSVLGFALILQTHMWAQQMSMRCSAEVQSIAFGDGLRAMLQGSRVLAGMVAFLHILCKAQTKLSGIHRTLSFGLSCAFASYSDDFGAVWQEPALAECKPSQGCFSALGSLPLQGGRPP